MFKKLFKSSKKYKIKRNIPKEKNLELFKDNNRTKIGKQLDENWERLYE